LRQKILIGTFLALFAAAAFAFGPHRVFANVEWTLKKQLKLEAAPLDVASSVDGKWIFVLTSGEILVYSASDDKVVNRIPVDKTFDHLTYSVPDKSLIASSSAEKTLKIIQLEVIQHFSLEGLPFEGPKNAPVTLVVFSDYQ
jgi:protein-disulfide isomerase